MYGLAASGADGSAECGNRPAEDERSRRITKAAGSHVNKYVNKSSCELVYLRIGIVYAWC